jgi:hypothetical protein
VCAQGLWNHFPFLTLVVTGAQEVLNHPVKQAVKEGEHPCLNYPHEAIFILAMG